MGKLNNSNAIWIFVILGAVLLATIVIIRSFREDPVLKAGLSTLNVTVGEPLLYSDSSTIARQWKWEFGNGDYADRSAGSYVFKEPGRYQVRLTVNGKYERVFLVDVRQKTATETDRLVSINAPETAMQGEYIFFTGEGDDKQWRWEFGESSGIDSREKSPIYSYSNPGTYEVRLSTENTQYPVTHRIEIMPKYMEKDSMDVMTIIGADIRDKLQAISDGKSFNTNYNYILSKYLCSNEKTVVVVNNNKYNDIYSYCQGLRLIGKKSAIEQVVVEIKNLQTGCVDKMTVFQTEPQTNRK